MPRLNGLKGMQLAEQATEVAAQVKALEQQFRNALKTQPHIKMLFDRWVNAQTILADINRQIKTPPKTD